MIDDIVWEGPGSNLPDRCWDRQGVILRTLDIVAYKVSLPFRRDTHTIRRARAFSGCDFGAGFVTWKPTSCAETAGWRPRSEARAATY